MRQKELHSIEMARRGIDLSPAAWVIPDTGESGPWTLPRSFKIAELSPAEVKVGMSLGVLTALLLTKAQLDQYLGDLHGAAPERTALSLLDKVARAAECDRDAERASLRWRQNLRRWLAGPSEGNP